MENIGEKPIELVEANFNEDYAAGFSDGYSMGEEYGKMEAMKKLTDDWKASPEREEAVERFLIKPYWTRALDNFDHDFIVRNDYTKFRDSQEFANARHAFKKRMNSPWD